MFLRHKRIGKYTYVYLVESVYEGGRTRQHIIRNLGWRENVEAGGDLERLAASAARLSRTAEPQGAGAVGRGKGGGAGSRLPAHRARADLRAAVARDRLPGCDVWNKLIDQPWKIMSIGHRDSSSTVGPRFCAFEALKPAGLCGFDFGRRIIWC